MVFGPRDGRGSRSEQPERAGAERLREVTQRPLVPDPDNAGEGRPSRGPIAEPDPVGLTTGVWTPAVVGIVTTWEPHPQGSPPPALPAAAPGGWNAKRRPHRGRFPPPDAFRD